MDYQDQSRNFHTEKFPLCQHLFSFWFGTKCHIFGERKRISWMLQSEMLKCICVTLVFSCSQLCSCKDREIVASMSHVQHCCMIFFFCHNYISHEPTCPNTRNGFLIRESSSSLLGHVTSSKIRTAGGTNTVAVLAQKKLLRKLPPGWESLFPPLPSFPLHLAHIFLFLSPTCPWGRTWRCHWQW